MCDVCVYVFKGVYDLCVIVVMAAGNNVAGPGCVTRHCAHPAPATPAQGMINTGAPAFADINCHTGCLLHTAQTESIEIDRQIIYISASYYGIKVSIQILKAARPL